MEKVKGFTLIKGLPLINVNIITLGGGDII
jgi:hypothetical protein